LIMMYMLGFFTVAIAVYTEIRKLFIR